LVHPFITEKALRPVPLTAAPYSRSIFIILLEPLTFQMFLLPAGIKKGKRCLKKKHGGSVFINDVFDVIITLLLILLYMIF